MLHTHFFKLASYDALRIAFGAVLLLLAFNASHAEEAMRRMVEALGTQGSAAAGVWTLAQRHGAPTSLRELGLAEDALDRAADIATERPYWNPRPVDRAAVRAVLQAAFEGVQPD